MVNSDSKNNNIVELISYNMEYLKACQNKEIKIGISSGYTNIDRLALRFQNSDLIVIAARPCMGKTILACDIARYIAIDSNIPIAFLSLELTKEQLSLYMLWSESNIFIPRLRHGFFQKGDWKLLEKTSKDISEAPISLIDSHGDSVKEIISKIRELVQDKSAKVVFIDYFQLIRKGHKCNDYEAKTNEIARALKNLANDVNIPIVLVSKIEAHDGLKEDSRPTLSDLGEYGALNKYADLIFLIHRDISDDEDNDKIVNVKAEIICVKNRRGPLGTAYLNYKTYPCCRFEYPSYSSESKSLNY